MARLSKLSRSIAGKVAIVTGAASGMGRVRTCSLRTEPLAAAGHWLEEQRGLWTRRLDQLDALLLTLKDDKDLS